MGNCINAAPNEVAIISGCTGSRKVVGQCDFAFWCCNRVDTLELKLLTLEVRSINAETNAGVKLNVVGVCQLKVDSHLYDANGKATDDINEEMIDKACQHFLGRSDWEVRDALLKTMEGHQRQILGTMTVEEIYKDRETFAENTKESVTDDLKGLGYKLVSYTIQDISDNNGYMDALGATKSAETFRLAQEGKANNEAIGRKNASLAKAEADKVECEQACRKTIAMNAEMQKQFESEKELNLKKECYKAEVNTARANTEAYYATERAIQQQTIIKAQTQQLVEESTIMLEVTKLEAERQKKEAEGLSKGHLIEEQNKAAGLIAKAEAAAKQISLQGNAEGEALAARGKAEAEVLKKRAEAYREFGQAAITQAIVDSLPDITAQVGKSYSQVKSMTILSNDQQGGTLTGDISSVLSSLPIALKEISGIDMNKGLKKMIEGQSSKTAA